MSALPRTDLVDEIMTKATARSRVRAVMQPPSQPTVASDTEGAKVLKELEGWDLPFEHKLALSVLIRRARYDFETYLLLFNLPGHGYIYSKVHELLVSIVQGVEDGTIKRRQITSLPPQHGKSTVMSIEAASWLIGKRPGIQVAITGFSHELVTDFSKAIRDRVGNPIYQLIFPRCKIVFGSNKMDSWKLTNGSGLRAKPCGSKLTGRKVDWLIIDDPHAGREEAESITMRKRVLSWYFADCYSRLSPNAAVFIIATRWHPEDLIGTLTADDHVKGLQASGHEKEVFDVTNLPAICEDETIDPIGRKVGEALFPEQRDIRFLRAVEAVTPPYEWSSQYQGRPQAEGSGQADTSNFIYIDHTELPKDAEVVRSWDLAIGEKDRNDFIAGAMCAYDPEQDFLYIVDMWHGKKSWPKMRPILLTEAEEDKACWNCQRVGIEAVAGFGAVFQDVKSALLGEVRVQAVFPPKGGKLARALPWLNKIEAKRVYIVRGGSWVKKFIEELRTFPEGDHDDQIDAVSGAWEMLTGRNRNGGKRNADPARPNGAIRPANGSQPAVEQPEEEDLEDVDETEIAAARAGFGIGRPQPARR